MFWGWLFLQNSCNILAFLCVYRVKGAKSMQNAGNLEQLIERYGNTLLRTASAILGDVQEAEDVVQETVIKYLEKQPVFESHEHAKAWLLRVTINSCKSRLRSPWRRLRAPLLESYPAPQPQQRAAAEAVLALPPKERAAVHLYYYEGYKTAEIAALTGEPEGTVRSRLSRARVRLKDMLKEDES